MVLVDDPLAARVCEVVVEASYSVVFLGAGLMRKEVAGISFLAVERHSDGHALVGLDQPVKLTKNEAKCSD